MDIKCKDLHTDRLTDKINTLMFWTIKQIYFLFYFYKYLSYEYLSIFFEYNKLCKINISLSFVNINAVKPLKMTTPWGMRIRPSLRTLQMQPTVLWVRQPGE